MNLITTNELKAKIESEDSFILVMVLDEWQFIAKHIEGSINISSINDPKVRLLSPTDDIVVYCSSESCPASILAYKGMVASGFTSVRRYAGGLTAWEEAGHPLQGEMA